MNFKPPDNLLYQPLYEQLKHQKQSGLYRQRVTLESPQGVAVVINRKPCLSFCSNDYLGLANHPAVIQSFKDACDVYGVGSGASQLVNGYSVIHQKLEAALAEFFNRPRVLLFSTGYMANIGIISALLGRHDGLFEDKLNHASLIDGGLLSRAVFNRYRHQDMDHLSALLETKKYQQQMIISDGVFSMDGDSAKVPALVKLAKQHNAWLMIDDAHGIGVCGEKGGGILEQYRLTMEDVPILVGTFGKSFGTFGAFVAAESILIEHLIQSSRSFIYTTASPPAIAAASLTSLEIIQQEPWRRVHLQALIKRLRQGAAVLNIPLLPSESPIQPLVIGDTNAAVKLSQQLFENGIYVTAIRPPTVPEGTARLRITLSAAHTENQVDYLLDTLDRLYRIEG